MQEKQLLWGEKGYMKETNLSQENMREGDDLGAS